MPESAATRVSEFVLTLSCPDRPGIVQAVSSMLLAARCNIEDSQQYCDRGSSVFFTRVHFSTADPALGVEQFKQLFQHTAQVFGMTWEVYDLSRRTRTLIMVSRAGHCLNDLLFRYSTGALPVEVPAIVSNHADFAGLAESYGIPFHHLPVTAQNKAEQEQRLLEIVRENGVELVVLARYMQILSEALCKELRGGVINIHHSFLPSFKGAMPYNQAYTRGVKLIGATAHYVTPDLDEGPIIEQDVARVDHSADPARLTAVGRDVECQVLARAVAWHTEHRILVNGVKTVVFR
jgi:formyltetrahydrofolate deformylase